MARAVSGKSGDVEIRRLIEDRVKAVRAKDLTMVISEYAPDVVAFDVVNPMASVGLDAVRRSMNEWFSSFQGPIGFEFRDVTIATSGSVAFCRGLSGVSATTQVGGNLRVWYRTTMCFRKVDGRWMITHEHDSVSFDVETGKASLDLKPA